MVWIYIKPKVKDISLQKGTSEGFGNQIRSILDNNEEIYIEFVNISNQEKKEKSEFRRRKKKKSPRNTI